MFDFVQRNKRVMQIILAVVVLPFAFWGIDSYTRASKSDDVAATVDGDKISQQQFANELKQHQDSLREQLGQNLDPALLDSAELKRSVLDRLVSERIMLAGARGAKLISTDEDVARVISGIDAFQVDGKFDNGLYTSVLANQGMSPLGFEERIREDLLWQEIKNTYLQNGYTSLNVLDNIIRLNEQRRTVAVASISFQTFIAQTSVSDDEMKKYYNQNLQDFQIREQAKIEYIKFSIDNLLSKTVVDDEEARKYYKEHQAEFGTPEERRAAHILIAKRQNADQSAQDKAVELLDLLRTNPEKFSGLAKANSEDPGSAQNGGDLGYFGRGMMTKPFEDAVFSLKPGEISDVVKTDFGFHIIKLADIKPSIIQPYEKVKDDIIERLKMQKASVKYAEMAEQFSNTVYEQSDTLKPAAELVGSDIEQGGWIFNEPGNNGIWTAKLLQAVFNDEVLKNKRNTAAVEVAPNTLLAARAIEYKPSAVREFAEVQNAIKQKLKLKQAMERASKQGADLLARLRQGEKTSIDWAPAQAITRAQYGSLSTELVKQIFKTPSDKLPQYAGVEDEQKGYLLARIDAVQDGDAAAKDKRAQYVAQLQQLTGEEMLRAYLATAKAGADITLNSSGISTTQQ